MRDQACTKQWIFWVAQTYRLSTNAAFSHTKPVQCPRKRNPKQNTGISILNCKVEAVVDLIPVQSSFKSCLGRPWKEYSRTVFLQSYIGSLIESVVWLEWNGDFALKTLYGEYMNRGPGSNTSVRVKWPAGYWITNSSAEASQFTVGNFSQGGEGLPPTGFPFLSDFLLIVSLTILWVLATRLFSTELINSPFEECEIKR